jgi:hypothetical protein
MDKLTSNLIEALELDRKDRWSEAHGIVQKVEDPRAYWIHAYLHRKEGDLGNASYWYSRAERSMPDMGLDEEWQSIWDAIAEEPCS